MACNLSKLVMYYHVRYRYRCTILLSCPRIAASVVILYQSMRLPQHVCVHPPYKFDS